MRAAACTSCQRYRCRCADAGVRGLSAAFVQYHRVHPRPGVCGRIAYAHGVVQYPAYVDEAHPVVYFPAAPCAGCRGRRWCFLDFTNHKRSNAPVPPVREAGEFFEERSPGLCGLPVVYVASLLCLSWNGISP
jgi:hypothetical protein